MSQLSFDVIKRVWPKSGLVTLFKKYSRIEFFSTRLEVTKHTTVTCISRKGI